MILYSKDDDIYSDIIRMIVLIKGTGAKIINISDDEKSANYIEEISIITPNCNIPSLVLEDFAVYRLNVIIEALEDLYPFPQTLVDHLGTDFQTVLF